ncbi:ATP-binding protein [Actinoplanes sp. NBRC 101535]|uniref:ATP-binding protein n=1 Tax=Actinoplanes sp. NBRC 101535 TaxID=3032196 RepID=UPI0024A58CB4|nr:ATP-binding protein [Actinoplanes sp. NBRC 101535]GLY02435.1 ATP/GTP-binding protein [Actinoplanes sp. NBRC 101535]
MTVQLAPKAWRWRRSPLLGRLGLYAPRSPGIPSTTRQAEVLCTAISAPPTTVEGLVNGIDLTTGQPVYHDPFTAYENKIVSSPNVVVLGDLGKGKSSLIKTVFVVRQLTFRKRRVVVADRKDQGGEGEFSEICRQLGGKPVRFELGGAGSRLNLLDPVINVSAATNNHVAGQLQLLRAVVQTASGRPVDSWQGAALRAAHLHALRVAEADRRTPVLEDVVRALGEAPPTDRFGGLDSPNARETWAEAALTMRFDLERLLGDDLAGLFDGPTSKDVVLSERLTSFDLSQLPADGPAIPLVMTVLNTWLTNLLRRRRGWLTTFVAEEGWHLAEGVGARIFQRNSKLSRGIGLANVVALHHVSDIPVDSPAVSMLTEAGTAYLYAQGREADAQRCVDLYSLPSHLVGDLMTLPQGMCLLKIDAAAPLAMQHLRSRWEVAITDTDNAMNPYR